LKYKIVASAHLTKTHPLTSIEFRLQRRKVTARLSVKN
jgi:hypothetical protein